MNESGYSGGVVWDGVVSAYLLTEIFDVQDALFLQTDSVDGRVLRVGDYSAIATLGDAETVDGEARGFRELVVDFGGRGIGGHLNLLGELLNGFT